MQDKIIKFKENFEFNKEVASCFSDMLRRSIPDYKTLRELVFYTGYSFIKDGSNVIDLGASNGESIKMFIDYASYYKKAHFYLIDKSEPMLEEASKKLYYAKNTSFLNLDLTEINFNLEADLITSILTLQFIPIEYRPKILRNIYKALSDEGAFILVEKVICPNSDNNELFIKEYYRIKEENGYSKEQINNKKRSLENVLVPLTVKQNEELLKEAGFSSIECFWRYYNFCGWIIRK